MEATVKVLKLRPGAQVPAYQSAHAAGLDLAADLDSEMTLAPRARTAVPTGIAIEISPGFEGQVRPRSGRAINDGLTVINAPGTVDADYRGEVKVLLVNLGERPVIIRPGDRIAQLVISPVARAEILEVRELAETTRGNGGFGHTGR